jgi:Antitoxin to bacterial toxin RNase LS or RnlA
MKQSKLKLLKLKSLSTTSPSRGEKKDSTLLIGCYLSLKKLRFGKAKYIKRVFEMDSLTTLEFGNFQMVEVDQNQFVAIGLDYAYPNITAIEKMLFEKNFSGILYIDALLSNGVAFNRFMTGSVVEGVLDRKSIKVLGSSIVTQCLKAETQNFFKQNPSWVKSNLILTDDQKADLLK